MKIDKVTYLKKKAIAIYRAFSSNAHIKNWKNNFYTTKHKFCFHN